MITALSYFNEMRFSIVILMMFLITGVNAQHRNDKWCFGDSAGIDFSNLAQPVPIHSSVKSRGSCVSICDNNSNLLFYAYTRAALSGNTTLVKNRLDSLMLNGDNIIGRGWYMELVIVPDPGDTNKYYLFSGAVTTIHGFYYSIIDMTLDNGNGGLSQKNIQLLPDPANDGLTAVKHGNGRDWWVIHRKHLGTNNTFYKFLVSPSGISPPDTQNIGTLTATNTSRYIFNKEGNKLGMVMYDGTIETFDFDRCSGMLSNHILIRAKNTVPPAPGLWSCAFSPNSKYLYVSTVGFSDSVRLIQIDLQDTALYNGADTIWTDTSNMSTTGGGFLRLAPDDIIYFSCAWDTTVFNFPYPDSVYNTVNTHLSVINTPDSPGVACNFTPFSFYLGGARTYYGLPNNPDYDMPRMQGSPCDTVQWMGMNEQHAISNGQMYVSYIGDWEKAFINGEHLKGKNCLMQVFDITGKKVFESRKPTIAGGYFTFDLDCSVISKGVYVVRLKTENEVLAKKFVKN